MIASFVYTFISVCRCSCAINQKPQSMQSVRCIWLLCEYFQYSCEMWMRNWTFPDVRLPIVVTTHLTFGSKSSSTMTGTRNESRSLIDESVIRLHRLTIWRETEKKTVGQHKCVARFRSSEIVHVYYNTKEIATFCFIGHALMPLWKMMLLNKLITRLFLANFRCFSRTFTVISKRHS